MAIPSCGELSLPPVPMQPNCSILRLKIARAVGWRLTQRLLPLGRAGHDVHRAL